MTSRGLPYWAVPYLALVVLLILIPFDFGAPSLEGGLLEPTRPTPRALLGHLLHAGLFVPLGALLARAHEGRPRPWLTALAIALAAALVTEAAQLAVSRSASLADAGADVVGTLVGFFGFSLWSRRARVRAAVSLLGATPVLLALLAGASIALFHVVRPVPGGLEGWDPSYPLVLANEATGGRPWDGVLRRVALHAGRHEGGSPTSLLRYGFAEKEVEVEEGRVRAIAAVAGALPDAALRVGGRGRVVLAGDGGVETSGGALIRTDGPVPGLSERIRRAGGFTLLVALVARDPGASGPARIVSYSADPSHRNFTLAQQGRGLVFRVRTGVTGPNAMDPQLGAADCLTVGREHRVLCFSDGATSEIRVDGRQVGSLVFRRYPGLVDLVASYRSGPTLVVALLAVCWLVLLAPWHALISRTRARPRLLLAGALAAANLTAVILLAV